MRSRCCSRRPLYLLFELGVLLADIADRRARKRALQPGAVAWEQ
jgi:Sec-independent protein secretion pathway component TatC